MMDKVILGLGLPIEILILSLAFLFTCGGVLVLTIALGFILDIKRDQKNDKD